MQIKIIIDNWQWKDKYGNKWKDYLAIGKKIKLSPAAIVPSEKIQLSDLKEKKYSSYENANARINGEIIGGWGIEDFGGPSNVVIIVDCGFEIALKVEMSKDDDYKRIRKLKNHDYLALELILLCNWTPTFVSGVETNALGEILNIEQLSHDNEMDLLVTININFIEHFKYHD